MTCNTISLVSRLIWKCFKWKFIDIFEDVCSLHACFSADSFHLLCCIMPCESSWRFFGPPGISMVAFTTHTLRCALMRCADRKKTLRVFLLAQRSSAAWATYSVCVCEQPVILTDRQPEICVRPKCQSSRIDADSLGLSVSHQFF